MLSSLPFFFSVLDDDFSTLIRNVNCSEKRFCHISLNEGCQILGAPLYILSFQFSNKILSQFYIVLWTSRAMKLLSGTVTSCPDFHIRIHKKNNNATEDKKINTLNVRAKNSRFHRFYAKIQKITIFPAIDLWNL